MTSCEDSLLLPRSPCTATQLEIKYKNFYDFILDFSFKTDNMDNGFVGVIFRKKDDFNYYALEISKNFIRLKKMLYGHVTIFANQK